MSVDWKDIRAELPDEVRQRLDRKREDRQLGRAMAEVRKAMGYTQKDVAAGASMTQNTISKIENADDVLISSIVRYMRSIGGSVEIVLKTRDGDERRVAIAPDIAAK